MYFNKQKTMSVISKLTSSLNRRDEAPNVELAIAIAEKGDKGAVKELIDNLQNAGKDIQHDCIKVIYETGERKPELISPYAKEIIRQLDSKSNRMQWGAMTAVSFIVSENPQLVYAALPKIIDIADKGSVITKDYAVNILIKLTAVKKYSKEAFNLLIHQLKISAANQLPMYAERALPVITAENKELFVKTLQGRLNDVEKETKRKRIEKVINKLKK